MLILLSTLALAADKEFAVDAVVMPVAQGSGEAVGLYGATPMAGLRVGWPVHKNVAILGTLEHGASGAEIEIGDGSFSSGMDAAWWGTLLGAGVKVNYDVAKWFEVYGTAQALGVHQLVRVDDDSSVDDNLTQVEAGGLTGGATGSAGVSFRIPFGNTGVSLAFTGELGYLWTAPDQIGDMGPIQLSGVTGRVGTGLRF